MHVCLCVCSPRRLLITSGMMWCDIDPIWYFLNKFYGYYIAAVVGIVSGHGLSTMTSLIRVR